MTSSSVVVIDNGGGLIKAGFGGDRDPISVVPNCLARPLSSSSSSKKWLIADDLLSPSSDLTSASLRRPIDRGYLINPDLQRDIWDRLLRLLHSPDPTSSSLLLVDPLFNPPSLQGLTDELVFEDFGFKSLFVADSPSLVHLYEASRRHSDDLAARAQCSLVVDCGFSFSHAAPVVQNFTLNYGVKRLDLGGKALTNYLKELISYRSINVMDETFIVDDAKEKLCFVSQVVPRDLQLARKSGRDNPFKCTYVLPDGIEHTKGYVKDMDEAQRYLNVQNGSSEMKEAANDEDNSDRAEGRRRNDVPKNVRFRTDLGRSNRGLSHIFCLKCSVQEFNLTNERFLVPEMLFRPADLGSY